MHTCTFVFLPISVFLSYFQPLCILKMSAIEKGTQAHAGVSHSPPLSPSRLLLSSPPPPLSCSSVLCCSCVLSTRVGTWLKAQATSLFYCPAHSTAALTTLSWREALCCQPVTSAGALQQKAGASQPASPHCFVSAEHRLMCSFHEPETAAKEDTNNHLKNKNIPLKLVKDKLQFQ